MKKAMKIHTHEVKQNTTTSLKFFLRFWGIKIVTLNFAYFHYIEIFILEKASSFMQLFALLAMSCQQRCSATKF